MRQEDVARDEKGISSKMLKAVIGAIVGLIAAVVAVFLILIAINIALFFKLRSIIPQSQPDAPNSQNATR
jgi:cytoskeletal protein RodZ